MSMLHVSDTVTTLGYLRYWAKIDRNAPARYHRAAYHCLDVGAVAQEMFRTNNRFAASLLRSLSVTERERADTVRALIFLITLHDVGKFSVGFQSLSANEALLEELGTPLNRKENGSLRLAGYPNRHDTLGFLFLGHVIIPALTESLGELSDASSAGSLRRSLEPLLEAVAGHHGAPVQKPSAKCRPVIKSELTDALRADMITYSKAVADVLGGIGPILQGLASLVKVANSSGATWLLSGFTSLVDWIGSSEAHFPFDQREMSVDAYWEFAAIPRAKAALRALRIGEARPSAECDFSTLFPEITDLSPMQRKADSIPLGERSQLFLIEDLTGSGKTEAALRLASRLMAQREHGSIYFALPTRATANGLFPRIHKVVPKLFSDGSPNLVLTHGDARSNDVFSSLLSATQAGDFYGGAANNDEQSAARCSAWLTDNSKKAFFADIGVGTIDQALLGVLPARYMALRLLGLAGGVLILDEVHAYDTYTSTLIQELLAAMAALNGHVILLSATLTNKQRESLAQAYLRGFTGNETRAVEWATGNTYPLLTHIAPEYLESQSHEAMQEFPVDASARSARTFTFETIGSTEDASSILQEAAQMGACGAWVRNSVDSAIDAYETLARQFGNERVHLFHSRFTRSDRTRIENDILNRFGATSDAISRSGHIVVATQVIEQSLDLDFDHLVTDLAPFDLLLQRAGRWRRHKRDIEGNRLERDAVDDHRVTAPIRVVCPPSHSIESDRWLDALLPFTSLIYDAPEVLWRTAREIEEKPTVILPLEARQRLEQVYQTGAESDAALPDSLYSAALAARELRKTQAAQGTMRSFKIEREQYTHTGTAWSDDDHVPTRLIRAQRQLRFVWLVGDNELEPWDGTDWKSGDIQIGAYRCAEITRTQRPAALRAIEWSQIIDNASSRMPDRGRYVDVIPFSRTATALTFQTCAENGDLFDWEYSALFGLRRLVTGESPHEI